MADKVNNKTLPWQDLFKPIAGLKTGVKNQVVIDREIIPIIFVPGIMGSRLRNKHGDKVWDPDDAWYMVKNFGLFNVSAAERKKLIIDTSINADKSQTDNKETGQDENNVNNLKVDNEDIEHNAKFEDSTDITRHERGWA